MRPFSRPFSELLLGRFRNLVVRALEQFDPLLANLECQPFGAAVGNADRRLLTAPIGGASQGPFRCPWKLPFP